MEGDRPVECEGRQSPLSQLMRLVADRDLHGAIQHPPADAWGCRGWRSHRRRGAAKATSTIWIGDCISPEVLAVWRDVASQITRIGVAPAGLIGAAGKRGGAIRLPFDGGSIEQRRQYDIEPGGDFPRTTAVGLASLRSISEIIERLTPLRGGASSDMRCAVRRP